MITPDRFMTATLRSSPVGDRITRILQAAIQAVDPLDAVARNVQLQGDRLTIGDSSYNLNQHPRLFAVGAGKAGEPMAQAIHTILADRITAGVVVVKEGYRQEDAQIGPIKILEAGHPLPDERGRQGSEKIISLLQDTRPDDLVLCLISGGGSALMVSPVPGVTLSDLQEMTQVLLACGADIYEINSLRKHLEQLKGGKLARLAQPAKVATLILSDVVGDPLNVIASGPTVPDPFTFEQAFSVLSRYGIIDQVPRSIVDTLEKGRRGEMPENLKPGDPIFENVDHTMIGSNYQAAKAALDQAAGEGFQSLLLSTYLQGEAGHMGRVFAAIARQIDKDGHPLPRPACLIAGGETTVVIQGDGLGGRNQEMALGAVADFSGLPNMLFITLATDGGDGPTDAAGAVISGETLERARQIGLIPSDYLARNDSYHFFAALDDLIKTGPTYTNVNDLSFLFAY
jgi:glycerate 2-kinase